MSNPTDVATQFVQFYYEKFDSDRSQLAPLYRDQSMLTFEANPYVGTTNIVKKLQELSFTKVSHQVHTLDAQPSNSSNPSIIVLVTGALLVDGEENPLKFSQAFHLVQENGTYFVLNDVFRLVLVSSFFFALRPSNFHPAFEDSSPLLTNLKLFFSFQ
ncbi:Nuclear transport factor 2, variant 2 [Puccinia graminis f. sp. tritici]|uniref:Nuclear transport factor 2 n=1 Tax=Puccinia graminis f. sp. tritici TaxID=56615 RepID=A0A5B0R8X4_PUCGR|nr:Nuclear transport factor 2, variant 2 [Puccinia graminis f. sp. tritici]